MTGDPPTNEQYDEIMMKLDELVFTLGQIAYYLEVMSK